MQEVMIFICFAATIAFGFYVMSRIDNFLDRNYKETHKEQQGKTSKHNVSSADKKDIKRNRTYTEKR